MHGRVRLHLPARGGDSEGVDVGEGCEGTAQIASHFKNNPSSEADAHGIPYNIKKG